MSNMQSLFICQVLFVFLSFRFYGCCHPCFYVFIVEGYFDEKRFIVYKIAILETLIKKCTYLYYNFYKYPAASSVAKTKVITFLQNKIVDFLIGVTSPNTMSVRMLKINLYQLVVKIA